MSTISNDALSALSESSRACIERLFKYEAEYLELTSPNQYVPRCDFFGPMRSESAPGASDSSLLRNYRIVLAAVLVVLYERPGGRGRLRVLLTTRSKELRSHPGQTALPGGKVDKTDAGVVETAVSIPPPSPTLPHLL